jgi:hypothetical protein
MQWGGGEPCPTVVNSVQVILEQLPPTRMGSFGNMTAVTFLIDGSFADARRRRMCANCS